MERDAKLTALEERADALQDGAAQFEKQAASMKNKFWMENLKSMIMMGVVGVLVLALLYWKFFMDSGPPPQYYMPPPPPPQPAAAPADAGSQIMNPLTLSLQNFLNICFQGIQDQVLRMITTSSKLNQAFFLKLHDI